MKLFQDRRKGKVDIHFQGKLFTRDPKPLVSLAVMVWMLILLGMLIAIRVPKHNTDDQIGMLKISPSHLSFGSHAESGFGFEFSSTEAILSPSISIWAGQQQQKAAGHTGARLGGQVLTFLFAITNKHSPPIPL